MKIFAQMWKVTKMTAGERTQEIGLNFADLRLICTVYWTTLISYCIVTLLTREFLITHSRLLQNVASLTNEVE